ncbi:MAG: site-2 protease family protein [Bacteroidetes bacterium]|nr:site-2 protease family protein [Bacteroidota bacterium]
MNVVIFFLILLVLVIAHEFGHFFAAKKFGIRVDEFGFGFPPKLFGKKYERLNTL